MIDSIEMRFLQKLRKAGSCWEWIGRRSRQGYGMFWDGSTMALAHRAAYWLFCNEIPSKLNVLHRCDNPPCCNPMHLFVGTQQDNMDDMKAKGRSRKKITAADIFAIQSLQAAGITQIEIATKFDVHKATIQRIAPVGGPKGERNASSVLTTSAVRDIRWRGLRGERLAGLAREYGVSEGAIWKILRGRTWDHVSWFADEDIQAALSDDVQPLFSSAG